MVTIKQLERCVAKAREIEEKLSNDELRGFPQLIPWIAEALKKAEERGAKDANTNIDMMNEYNRGVNDGLLKAAEKAEGRANQYAICETGDACRLALRDLAQAIREEAK